MANTFTFEIHTPMRFFLSCEAEGIVVALVDGEFGILANHGRFTAPVIPCIARIKNESGEWKEAYIGEGIIEVKKHKTVVLVDDAAWANEIDAEQARAVIDEIAPKITDKLSGIDRDELKAKLEKAELKLKLAASADKNLSTAAA